MKLYACMTLLAICTIIMGGGDSAAQGTAEKEISVAEKQESMGASTEKAVDEKKSKQNDLGAFSPEAAFEYMKEKRKRKCREITGANGMGIPRKSFCRELS